MLYGSRKSRKKLYHYGNCRYAMLTSPENRLMFPTANDAIASGFKQCPCCSRIPSEYKKNERLIKQLCDKYNLKAYLKGDEMYVISRGDTAWIICMLGDGTKRKRLLHENLKHVSYNRKKTPYEERDFHVQDLPSTSITGYLTYIRNHDTAAQNREKQKKKNTNTISAQVNSIKETQRRIAKQNRKRKLRGPAESNTQKRRRANQHLREITRSFNDYRAARAAYI